MGFDFNADEMFKIAVNIEINGANFYRKMSENITDSSIRQKLLDLAAMEEAHEKIFEAMRKDISDRERKTTVFDPQGETALYLKAFADFHVFDDEAEEEFVLSEELSEEAKMRKILRAAMNIEWESIAFYAGMKELVPENLGKARINEIIKEEMRHVKLLRDELASLKS